MPSEEPIKKLYHSIGEVSEITEVDQHVLRFWESEFKELSPKKNSAGRRQYRSSDIELIQRIKYLLYKERFTIEGAKRKLKIAFDETKLSDSGIGESGIPFLKKGLDEIKGILDS